ncbi:MAG: hypothetical protein PHE84_10435 [bacterium]|nr:hypothetical protein [bacterium]
MRKNAILFILIMTMIFSFKVNDSYADPNPTKAKALKGIKSMSIVVRNLSQAAKDLKLTKEKIMDKVDRKIRPAGIIIISETERKKMKDTPFLYVDVDTTLNHVTYVCNFFVQLRKDDPSERDPRKVARATIWESGIIGGGEKDVALEWVNETLDNLIDNFVDDYSSVNPKTGSKQPAADNR